MARILAASGGFLAIYLAYWGPVFVPPPYYFGLFPYWVWRTVDPDFVLRIEYLIVRFACAGCALTALAGLVSLIAASRIRRNPRTAFRLLICAAIVAALPAYVLVTRWYLESDCLHGRVVGMACEWSALFFLVAPIMLTVHSVPSALMLAAACAQHFASSPQATA
jgi:hypothetical protein